MDAIVLAGGYATRLWPITRHRPKMFLPVGETTVIDRIFTELETDDRIDRVFVSTNERFAEDFETYLASAPYEKPRLSVEETTTEDEKFGVIAALAQLVRREGIDDDTLVIAGDNLISFSVSEFLDHFGAHDGPTLAAYDVGDVDRARSYGVLAVEDGHVQRFREKPEEPESTLVSVACYGFPAATLDRLGEFLETTDAPDEIGWFIQWLVDRADIGAFVFDEAWFDIGTPESYLDAVSWYLDGDALVHPEATVENSTIGANVHVMAGAEVTDSRLERTVVFPEATIRSCDVRSSIIDENTVMERLDLQGAQVGADTTLTARGDE